MEKLITATILFSKAILSALLLFDLYVLAEDLSQEMRASPKTTLYIHNQNCRDLVLIIKSSDKDSSLYDTKKDTRHGKNFKDGWGIASIPGHTIVQMEIPDDEISENCLLSISGETDMLTPRGICELSAGKSYSLTFMDNHMGTKCIHQEVTCCPYPDEHNIQKVTYGKCHPFTILNNINAIFLPSFDVVVCS